MPITFRPPTAPPPGTPRAPRPSVSSEGGPPRFPVLSAFGPFRVDFVDGAALVRRPAAGVRRGRGPRAVVPPEPAAEPVQPGEQDPFGHVRLVELVPHLPLQARRDDDPPEQVGAAGEPLV